MKDNKEQLIYMLILTLEPLILIAIVTTIFGGEILNYPQNNDEVAWYSQIASVVKYGRPLGYWGYNETHASFGTFGPWGIFTLLPYSIIGKIIGWNIYTMSLCNIFFLCLANLIFCLVTKIKSKEIKWLILINVFFYINILYSMSSMSECLRFFFSICLCALLLRMLMFECSNFYKYCLVPVIIILAGLVYIMFVSMLPIYVFILIKDKRLCSKLICSFLLTFILGVLLYGLLISICSPYTSSQINDVIITIQGEGIISGIIEFMQNLVLNFRSISLLTLMKNINYFGMIIVNYITMYYLIIFFFVFYFINEYKKNRENIYLYTGGGML